jgi:hypothetical protein
MTYRRALCSLKLPDKSKFEVHSVYALSLCPKGFERGAGENFFLKVFPCRIPTNQNLKFKPATPIPID